MSNSCEILKTAEAVNRSFIPEPVVSVVPPSNIDLVIIIGLPSIKFVIPTLDSPNVSVSQTIFLIIVELVSRAVKFEVWTDLISNFKRKFVREGGEFLTEEESRIKSRKKRAFKEADLQIKLLEATNKDEFFDPKKFAKENDISLAKVKNEAKKLQKNIYVKRMLESGKENITRKLEWLPNDVNLADNALDKLYK